MAKRLKAETYRQFVALLEVNGALKTSLKNIVIENNF
jgi:hypothetical protein